MEFSERLRQLREKHGYTQKQLADAVHLSKNSICNYEKNVNLPNIETLMSVSYTHLRKKVICFCWTGR